MDKKIKEIFKDIYKYKASKLFLTFIIVSIVLIVLANIKHHSNPLTNENSCEICYGVITDKIAKNSLLQYSYTTNDNSTLVGESVSGYDEFNVGDKITVKYLKDNPVVSEINGFNNDPLYLILNCWGAFFFVVGAIGHFCTLLISKMG
jgi:hypothetical protein